MFWKLIHHFRRIGILLKILTHTSYNTQETSIQPSIITAGWFMMDSNGFFLIQIFIFAKHITRKFIGQELLKNPYVILRSLCSETRWCNIVHKILVICSINISLGFYMKVFNDAWGVTYARTFNLLWLHKIKS